MVERIRQTTNKYFLYLLVVIFIIKYYLSTINIDIEYLEITNKIFAIIYYLYLLGTLLTSKYNIKEILIIVGMFSLVLIFRTSFSKDIFMIITSFLLINKLQRKNFIKIVAITCILVILGHTLLYVMKFLPENTLIEYELSGKTNIRKSLGFLSVNALTLFLFFLYIYNTLRTKIYSKSNILIIFFMIIAVIYTKNRTIIIAILLMNLIYFILKLTKLNSKIINFGIKISYFLLGVTTLYIGLTYKLNGILFVLDNVLSYRLRFWANMIQKMELKNYLKGNNIYQLAKKMENPIDNSYIYSIFGMGILFFIAYSILYYILMKKLIEEKKYKEITILLVFSIYSFVENIYFYAIFNPTFLIMLDYLLYNKKGKVNERNISNNT